MVAGNSAAARGNTDSRLASALRSLTDRVRALESRPVRRYGAWLLGVNESGDLVAIHEPTGLVTPLATVPGSPMAPPSTTTIQGEQEG